MITTADVVRELIEGMFDRLLSRGCDIRSGEFERLESLWMEVEAHLRRADMSEILNDSKGVERSLDKVNCFLNQILEEMPG